VNQSDPEATCDLGYMYLEGCGVKKSAFLAMNYFKLAAQHGYARAQANLGYSTLKVLAVRKIPKPLSIITKWPQSRIAQMP
jgi:TPR repeat protein